MPQQIILGGVISSTFSSKLELQRTQDRFNWQTVKVFICIADTFACTAFNYDTYSSSAILVHIFLCIIFIIVVGVPYMCMDFFVKLYTGKIGFQESLNPLLKAVHYGVFFQTIAFTTVHANDLVDSVIFFGATLSKVPKWSECSTINLPWDEMAECVSTINISISCNDFTSSEKFIPLNKTSAHYYYEKLFHTSDRILITKRMFVMAVVWLCNFSFCSLSDQVIIKLFNVVFMFRSASTIVSAIFMTVLYQNHIRGALTDILNIDLTEGITESCAAVMYVFGIGVVGVYDFGVLPPNFTVDNAVVIFAVVYVVLSFLRSLSVSILHQIIKRCIFITPTNPRIIPYHYFLFAIIPLGSDFLNSQKIYTTQLYLNLVLALIAHIVAVSHSISKMLLCEFPTVKEVYITGVLSIVGFIFSVLYDMYPDEALCCFNAFTVCLMVLGAQKSAIIMYLYGVQRFATDILFWLGYKPTKYWINTWSVLPILLAVVFIKWCLNIPHSIDSDHRYHALIWIGLISLLVVLLQLRTIMKYIALNKPNVFFRSSVKYGPPDVDERRRRRQYDEALRVCRCTHKCVVTDDKIDCNHMPIMNTSKTEVLNDSLTQVFEAEAHRKQIHSGTIVVDERTD